MRNTTVGQDENLALVITGPPGQVDVVQYDDLEHCIQYAVPLDRESLRAMRSPLRIMGNRRAVEI